MAPELNDPTAGRTARDIQRDPNAPRPILDPTDPRYGREPGRTRPARRRGGPGHVKPRGRR
jgi:hypothetical protein